MRIAVVLGCALSLLGCNDIGHVSSAHSQGEPGQDAGAPPPPPAAGCVRTHGYWKNHEEVWSVTSLMLGAQTYDAAELDALLSDPARGDASRILAMQLIAAKMNVAAGASSTLAIAEADAWLATYAGRLPLDVHASTAEGQVAVAIASQLDLYNNGGDGPEHCDDRADGGPDAGAGDDGEGDDEDSDVDEDVDEAPCPGAN
jgi:hypothetical protein